MKFSFIYALPLAFSFCFTAAHAESVHVNAGVNIGGGGHHGHEYRMRVAHRDGHYYGTYNNREYILRGDAVAHINADGEYTVYGDFDNGNTYLETTEVAPIVVTEPRREVIVEQPRREVIVEQPRREVIIEKREPFIKVGPVRIGD